jgi:hypothetical protein
MPIRKIKTLDAAQARLVSIDREIAALEEQGQKPMGSLIRSRRELAEKIREFEKKARRAAAPKPDAINEFDPRLHLKPYGNGGSRDSGGGHFNRRGGQRGG